MQPDDPRIEEVLRDVLAVGPAEATRQFIAMATADLMKLGVPMERAKDMMEAAYHIGWRNALTFYGTSASAWPDGTPLFDIVRDDQSKK